MTTTYAGTVPYINDDTRRWQETYRVGNKVKPAFVFRAGTDSNYINDQFIPLRAYANNSVFARSICNVVSPGQRIPGCLSWQTTESLENITQTAQLTALDAIPQSRISTTITNLGVGTGASQYTMGGPQSVALTGQMPAQWHSGTIRYQWVSDGNGIAHMLTGDQQINSFQDLSLKGNPYTTTYQENNLLYRIFEPEVIKVQSLANFPDPAVPNVEQEGNNEWWNIDFTGSLQGVGAYYVLVGNEVMRVTRIDRNNNYLFIVPGGRGVADTITSHSAGETVTLLGFPPYNGKWAAFGYLMPSDYKVSQSPFRPGTCYVSYEGYGNPGDYQAPYGVYSGYTPGSKPGLSKTYNRANNMCFTGYWFSESPQVTLDNSGVPQLTVTFQSPGYLLSEQKIDPNNIQRSKTIFYSWAKATFDQVGYNRKIPGDWFDYNIWDPTLPGAYPMTISTEYAQHKAFFDHMNDTDMGRTCQYCQAEWLEYIKQHEKGKPTGSIAEARAVGKHIYKESIRVFNKGGEFNAGPIKTFGRLMTALAMAAWENPLEGNELGTRWTKIPNQLFSNMNNWINGRVWNGQLAYDTVSSTKGYDWSNQTVDDFQVNGSRLKLKCPFTSQYDRQPWSQPMADLADINRMTYTLTREGFPIFAPLGKKLRGIPNPNLQRVPGYSGPQIAYGQFIDTAGNEVADNDIWQGEWHLSYGGSIDSYSHTLDPSSVFTLVYVSCQTAFGDEVTFTIPAAGTGIQLSGNKQLQSAEKILMYSNKIGNKDGLQLTSGVQQTDEVALDNLLLGLEWSTDPASWGLTVKRGPDKLTQVDAQPPIPRPKSYAIYYEAPDIKKHHVKEIVRKLQKFINFMLQRRYIGPAVFDDNGTIAYPLQINESGKFTGNDGKATDSGLKNLQRFLTQQGIGYSFSGGFYRFTKGNYTYGDQPGVWGHATYFASKQWMTVNAEYIKTDVWWYVQNGLPWEQYVGAITGMPIPQRRDDQDSSKWVIDQQALKTEAETWMKQFFKDAINYGSAIVDDSINKATQKVLTTNFADPRIQLGDVIWANVVGYLSPVNAFGSVTVPFLHGIYLTGVTRSMDLRAGTYQATYSGYRYRGNFESTVTQNPSNFCSTHTQI